MKWAPVIVKGVAVLFRLLPSGPPPKIDYLQLRDSIPMSPTLPLPPSQENQPAEVAPRLSLPTTAQTLTELKRRLGKELYRVEMDLQGGARIAGLPCDCLSRSKHLGGIEATAEELMSYERNPVYGQVIEWFNQHEPEFEPAEIAKRPPEYYQGLAPEVRGLRKQVTGTEDVMALVKPEEKQRILQVVKKQLGIARG